MAKKVVTETSASRDDKDLDMLIVPADVAGDPNLFAVWFKKLVTNLSGKFRKKGINVGGVGGQCCYTMPGGHKIISRPQDFEDYVHEWAGSNLVYPGESGGSRLTAS